MVRRMDRTTIVYPIDDTTIRVGNPCGGSIYIEAPIGSDEGVVEVTITGAVRSPYFSAKSFHMTTEEEWDEVERHHPAPWADFQSDRFMMQVPRTWIYNMTGAQAIQTMQDWDDAMDVQNDLMGVPHIRGKETMYLQPDKIMRSSVHAPGYPAVNVTVWNPMNDSDDGDRANYFTRGPDASPNATHIEVHEQGHAYRFPKFNGNTEVEVNIAHVAVQQRLFGRTWDVAFRAGTGQSHTFRTLDNTAVKWMTSFSFSPINRSMQTGEKAYQLKGYAPFVEIARLFGWEGLGDYYRSFMEYGESGDNDEKHLRMARHVGWDTRPLLHFWGLRILNSAELAAAIDAEGIPPSAEIYDLLVHYKSLVPPDNAAFQDFAYSWWGGVPSPNAFWTQTEHARQWDQSDYFTDWPNRTQQRADITINEEYIEACAQQVRDRVQEIIDLYFPHGRPGGVHPPAMSVARGEVPIVHGGVDGVSDTMVGSASEIAYLISNEFGSFDLELSDASILAESNCEVTVITQPSDIVVGGGGTSLALEVAPAAGGAWSFNVSIPSNDADADPYTWTVMGIAGDLFDGEETFTAVADTYIDSHDDNANFGTATTLQLNNQTGGASHNRLLMQSLVRFDLSSIPSSVTILSAELGFVQDNNRSVTFGVYEATGSWGESTVTWNNSEHLHGSTSFGSATTGTTAGEPVPTITLNEDGLSLVQGWLATPGDNHGFHLLANEMGNTQNYLALRSREHATESHRPRLTIEYEGGSGVVSAPLMAATQDGKYLVSGDTDAFPWTETGVGAQRTYAITNLGTADLALTTPVKIASESNCSVVVDAQPSGTVAVSGSTELVLTVTPTTVGAWSATVAIANNDPDNDPYTWTISGTALGRYSVTYHANQADNGDVPVDVEGPYLPGSDVTVLGNTGDLERAGFVFDGWNTAADGTGTAHAPEATFVMPEEDVTLYARWNAPPEVDAGTNQTVYLTEDILWTPERMNVVAWFDAMDESTLDIVDDRIRGWDDKSGNDNHAVQNSSGNRPPFNAHDSRLNDLPTVGRSLGDYTFLETTGAFEMRNAYIVTYYDNDTFPSHRVLLSQNINEARVQGRDGGTSWRTEYQFTMYRDGSESSTSGALPMGPTLWRADAGSSIDSVWRLLGGANSWAYWDHGAAGEFIFTDGSEDTETRQKIEGYLAHKWGLADNWPSDHPYRKHAPGSATAVTSLEGFASDPDGDPLTTVWTAESGPASVTFADASVTNTTATFFKEGVYTLRLTADDGFQQSDDEVEITVIRVHSVTYDGNDHTGGTVPTDSDSPYEVGEEATVLGAGDLVRTGYTFDGWNTASRWKWQLL